MSSKNILRDIQGHLASALATRVLYVEGKTDPPLLFGLLGVVPATTGHYVHKGTLVKDIGGRENVEQYVAAGAASPFAGRVLGLIDGDGDEYATLRPRFDAPYTGPLFAWKAYCIESLFPLGPWNPAWGTAPAWQVDLEAYAPYVGLCRTHVLLEGIQEQLQLARRTKPDINHPLLTVPGEKARLAAAKHQITGFDAEATFDTEVHRFRTAVGRSVAEAMALLDGKWLFGHFMVTRCGGGTLDRWRDQWKSHMTAAGGLPEVRDLWQRITGTPP